MVTSETGDVVRRTAVWSIYIQLAFTSVTAGSLLLPLDGKEVALIHIAILETVSQVVEFVYYMLAVYYYRGIRTWTRYIDWYVSTPVMLISFMAFYVYRNSGRTLDVLFTDPQLAGPTAAILFLNAAMLTLGLTAELRGDAERPPALHGRHELLARARHDPVARGAQARVCGAIAKHRVRLRNTTAEEGEEGEEETGRR